MPKSSEYKEKILKIIEEEKSLNFISLQKKVMTELNRSDTATFNKNYLEVVINLLKDYKLFIDGYDHTVLSDKRHQSQWELIKGLVLGYLKQNTPLDITNWLNHLESSKIEDYKYGMKKLEKVFTKKFNQVKDLELFHWNNLKAKSKSTPLKKYIKDLEKKISKFPDKEEGKEKFDKNRNYMRMIQNLETYKIWVEEYPDAYIWELENVSDEEVKAQLEITKRKQFQDQIKYPSQIKGRVANHLTSPLSYDILVHKETPLIDEKHIWNSEIFLEKKGFLKPKSISPDEIKSIFNKMLFFANSHENYKFMKQCLSWALSDEEDSIEWFKILLDVLNPSYEKLQQDVKEMGIDPEQEYMKEIHEMVKNLK